MNETRIEGIPVSAVLTIERSDRYGSIEGLEEDEMAGPVELERQAHLKDYGPIMALPYRGRKGGSRPDIDESGDIEWGAFGSVDFSRLMPKFDKMRYKIDRLKEELADATIFIDIIRDRIPGNDKYVILKQLKMGLIELEHITDPEVHSLARHCLRAWRLRREIRDVQQAKYRSGR